MKITKTLHVTDRKKWRAWLRKHYKAEKEIWLVYYKKATGKPRIEYNDAVEEALCFGWIDSVLNPIDDKQYMQLFTPRKSKSNWSKLNKDRVAKLIEADLMTPSGLAKIEAARKDGSWTNLDAVEALQVPPDLAKAFAKNKKALANFEALSPSRKKMLLYWVNAVKRAETRAPRIAHAVKAMENGLHPREFAGVGVPTKKNPLNRKK
jgi:uncharacterized protein YdeI (YjbR/CyaY-like superfamily)